MLTNEQHLTIEAFEAGLEEIRRSPKDGGRLEMIVRRPQGEQREVLQEGQLDAAEGLLGDNWKERGSARTPDGSPHPDMQLTIMNTRLIALLAQEKSRWQLAGDQLFIDLDLSADNLPPGTQLALGSAVIEITDQPHTGCIKFSTRFGLDAIKFVSSEAGKELRLRGIYAKIVQPGTIRVGDIAKKIAA
jgi:hypothetical protein